MNSYIDYCIPRYFEEAKFLRARACSSSHIGEYLAFAVLPIAQCFDFNFQTLTSRRRFDLKQL